jgi:hypothetical protein
MRVRSPALTAKFAHGWRKLPDELKLDVLNRILPYNDCLPVTLFGKKSHRNRYADEDDPLDMPLLWCLFDLVDFSACTVDVLSKNNSFSISTHTSRREYALPFLTPHIQRLELVVHTTVSDWEWLATLARGGLSSFQGLCEISIMFLILSDYYVKNQAYWNTLVSTGTLTWDVDIMSARFNHPHRTFTANEVAALEGTIGRYLQRRKDVQT